MLILQKHIGLNSLVHNFIDLQDTPETYTSGKYLYTTTTGIVFSDLPTTSFIQLSDCPSFYSVGQYLMSTSSGTKWVTIPTPVLSFIGLSDSPGIFDDGKYLQSTTIGTQWASIPPGITTFSGLSDTPDAYSSGQFLQSTSSGSQWAIIYFTNINGLPSSYSNGYFLQSTASGSQWVATGVIDHNSLLNTHNLTTSIDHNQITNTHQNVSSTASPSFVGLTVGGSSVITSSANDLKKIFPLKLFRFDESVISGSGREYIIIPSEYDGYYLINIEGYVWTPSTSGLPTIQIHNIVTGYDILSTSLSIDINENDSKYATTSVVINKSYNLISARDIIRFDVTIAGTGTKGFDVSLVFSKIQLS